MSKQRVRLIDILDPPDNPWLRKISQRNAHLPIGVRVVRLSGDDDDDQFSEPLASRSSQTRVSMRRSA